MGQHAFLSPVPAVQAVDRIFAIRLLHLGFAAYVVGETTTPALGKWRPVAGGIGFGLDGLTGPDRPSAVEGGGRVALVTIREGSPIGEMAEIELLVPAPTRNWKVQRRPVDPADGIFV
ncbi:MAG: hypothetical protein CM1200mP2_26380 [Planctomycetaceae bacterium]|nr:MAG: hypothetical protein CM1200mP2_26380 [Planctomycetaceae bacterium]